MLEGQGDKVCVCDKVCKFVVCIMSTAPYDRSIDINNHRTL